MTISRPAKIFVPCAKPVVDRRYCVRLARTAVDELSEPTPASVPNGLCIIITQEPGQLPDVGGDQLALGVIIGPIGGPVAQDDDPAACSGLLRNIDVLKGRIRGIWRRSRIEKKPAALRRSNRPHYLAEPRDHSRYHCQDDAYEDHDVARIEKRLGQGRIEPIPQHRPQQNEGEIYKRGRHEQNTAQIPSSMAMQVGSDPWRITLYRSSPRRTSPIATVLNHQVPAAEVTNTPKSVKTSEKMRPMRHPTMRSASVTAEFGLQPTATQCPFHPSSAASPPTRRVSVKVVAASHVNQHVDGGDQQGILWWQIKAQCAIQTSRVKRRFSAIRGYLLNPQLSRP